MCVCLSVCVDVCVLECLCECLLTQLYVQADTTRGSMILPLELITKGRGQNIGLHGGMS
jgi:hypothetical protein